MRTKTTPNQKEKFVLERPNVAIIHTSDSEVLVKPPKLKSGAGFEVMARKAIPASYWDGYGDAVKKGDIVVLHYDLVEPTYLVWDLVGLYLVAWLAPHDGEGSAGELLKSAPKTDRPLAALKLRNS